jgi:hypothetical protein
MTAQERWRGHVAAWAASGLSCKGYAAKAGINPRTLTWWKSKLGADPPSPAGFVEVTQQLAVPVVEEAGVIELAVGRTQIRVRGRVDTEALARVLDALEGRR